jgi:hypothetical protein
LRVAAASFAEPEVDALVLPLLEEESFFLSFPQAVVRPTSEKPTMRSAAIRVRVIEGTVRTPGDARTAVKRGLTERIVK